MSELESHSEIEVSSERSFGIVFAAFFGIIGLWPLTTDEQARIWALIVSCVLFLTAFIAPKLLRPLNICWFRLGIFLGRIVTPAVMFLLFFVAVWPTAMIMRALGKDLLHRNIDKTAASYWIERDGAETESSSMRNQF